MNFDRCLIDSPRDEAIAYNDIFIAKFKLLSQNDGILRKRGPCLKLDHKV